MLDESISNTAAVGLGFISSLFIAILVIFVTAYPLKLKKRRFLFYLFSSLDSIIFHFEDLLQMNLLTKSEKELIHNECELLKRRFYMFNYVLDFKSIIEIDRIFNMLQMSLPNMLTMSFDELFLLRDHFSYINDLLAKEYNREYIKFRIRSY